MPDIQIEFTVADPDAIAASEASDSLLEELDQLAFDRLERASGPQVSGTRAADPAAVGALVGLISSPVVLKAVVEVVKSWLMRQEIGSLTVTCGEDSITLTNPSRADQEALTAAFLERITEQ